MHHNHGDNNGINKKKNMHKVIVRHILILVGIAAVVGLFFLIRSFL
jgi:hypothetical protein